MKRLRQIFGVILLSTLFVSTASAEVHTGSQIGEVTNVDGSDSYLVSLWGVEVGDEVTIDYLYDSDRYDSIAYFEWNVKVQGYAFHMHGYEYGANCCGTSGHCLVDTDWPTLTAFFHADMINPNPYGTFNLNPSYAEIDFDYEGITSGILNFVLYDMERTYSETMTMSYNVSNPVVPEPISSTLFLIGGATLGFRRMRKKITN